MMIWDLHCHIALGREDARRVDGQADGLCRPNGDRADRRLDGHVEMPNHSGPDPAPKRRGPSGDAATGTSALRLVYVSPAGRRQP